MMVMVRARLWIGTLVAIAMAIASISSVWASTANIARAIGQQQATVSPSFNMPNCERMMRIDTADHRESYDPWGCADDFCMAKCFKVFGIFQPRILAAMVSIPLQPFRLDRPAIWFSQPPITPPRA
jgi:hypothetical protein